jgi:hypothetical protein
VITIAGFLAVLAASSAAGLRVALPLLVLGLLRSHELWSSVPILSHLEPRIVLCVLVSWSLFELLGSKKLLGQRILQLVEILFAPIAGAVMAISVLHIFNSDFQPVWAIGIIGGILALIIKLVEIGWFFRLRGIPLWVVCLEDLLCVSLVFFALEAPKEGGLIALFLLWVAIRSSQEWRRWYREKKAPGTIGDRS